MGVAFGAATTADNPTTAVLAAISVALGIGIQNFPEGAAVSIPLRQEGFEPYEGVYVWTSIRYR